MRPFGNAIRRVCECGEIFVGAVDRPQEICPLCKTRQTYANYGLSAFWNGRTFQVKCQRCGLCLRVGEICPDCPIRRSL